MIQRSEPDDPPPLTVSADKICYIIVKAREFEADDEEPESEPDFDPVDDRNLSELEGQGDNLVEDGPDDEVSGLEPDSNPTDDRILSELEEQRDNSAEDQLMAFIDGLNEDEQTDLVALAWLGRGDGSIDDWNVLRRQATDAHNERTAAYLLGIPLLPDYLEDALALFGRSCEDI